MGRGGGVSPKRDFKRGVQSKATGSDDSDEDYVVSDEENGASACSDEDFCSSADGYPSEGSDRFVEEEEERKVRRKVKKKVDRSKKSKKRYGRYKDEDENGDEDEDEDDEDEDYKEDEDEDEDAEEVKKAGTLKGGFSVQKNGVKPSQRRRRVGCKVEDEDDDDEEFTPSNDEEDDDDDGDDGDEDFSADEDDSLDEEESRVKRKKTNTKSSKRVLRKKSVRGRKRRKRHTASKKTVRKKARKACGFRRKVRSDDDDDDFDDDDFMDNELVLREQGEMKRGPKKRRFVVDSDSDFAPAPSNEYEYTISEEEREQVREAKEFCRVKADLRSSSVPEKIQEDKALQLERKLKGRKGKEKVEEEVKTEAAKGVCGICFSEEDKRRVRGTINCCAHYFCFTCISEWAKVESRCPLCKQRFNTISKRARSSTLADLRVVTIEIPERDQVYLPTEDELRSYLYPYEDVICSECHLGGHDDLMLLCDECDSSAHTFCVGLGHEVPEGSWFCRGCKPLDPESPNSPETHLPDQKLSVNNTSTIIRASVVINNTSEGFDLNSVSSQGVAGLPSPRQQFGSFQATMTLAGAGASTLSGRIRLRHQIHHCLSERPDRPEGNFPLPQLDQARETPIQQESDRRSCENHSPAGQGSDFFPPALSNPIRGTGQDPNPATVQSGLSNGALWPGLEERNSLQLRQCNGGPNTGYERQDVDFHTAKEQLQLMVKTHLKNLSRGSDLAQSKLEEIAKCSTQTILGACGLEHRSNETVVLPVAPPPPTCDHIEIAAAGKPSLTRGCCSSCFDSFVGDVVKKTLDAKLSEVQQWLCLAL